MQFEKYIRIPQSSFPNSQSRCSITPANFQMKERL